MLEIFRFYGFSFSSTVASTNQFTSTSKGTMDMQYMIWTVTHLCYERSRILKFRK